MENGKWKMENVIGLQNGVFAAFLRLVQRSFEVPKSFVGFFYTNLRGEVSIGVNWYLERRRGRRLDRRDACRIANERERIGA